MDTLHDRLTDLAEDAPTGGAPAADSNAASFSIGSSSAMGCSIAASLSGPASAEAGALASNLTIDVLRHVTNSNVRPADIASGAAIHLQNRFMVAP